MSDPQVIPETSIERLRNNPSLSAQFDQVYGVGAAASVLGDRYSDRERNDPIEDRDPNMPQHEHTIAGKIMDSTLGAVAYGAQEAVNETIDTIDWLDEKIFGLPGLRNVPRYVRPKEGGGFEMISQETLLERGQTVDIDQIEIALKDRPTTLVGQVVAGVSQFAIGFFATRRVTGIKGVLGAFVNGAIVDAAMFEPTDQNVTALLESVGVNTGAFGELMATDPDDPEWQNRLRNAGEGALAGAVVEMVFYAARARKLRASGRVDEAADAAASAARAEQTVQAELRAAAEAVVEDAEITLKQAEEIFGDLQFARNEDGTLRIVDPNATKVDPKTAGAKLEGLTEGSPRGEALGTRSRWLAPSEVEQVRLNTALAKTADPRTQFDTLSIKSINSARRWEDVMPTIQAIKAAVKRQWESTPGAGTETFMATAGKATKAAREMAVLLGEDVDAVIKRFEGGLGDKGDMAAELVARSMLIKSLLHRTDAMANAIAKGEFDPNRWPGYKNLAQLKLEYSRNVSIATALAKENDATRSSVARALNAMKLERRGSKELERILSQGGMEGSIDSMAKAHISLRQAEKADGKPGALLKTLQETASIARQTVDAVNFYRINALLSGPGTQEVNFVSNLINMIALPTQQIVGGALTLSPRMIKDGLRVMQGMVASSFDAIDASLAVWARNEEVLDPFQGKIDDAVLYEAMKNSKAGKVVGLPTRLLMSMDEFFKQSAYRGRIFADATAQAKELGLKGQAKVDHIKRYIADSFDDTGMATRDEALLMARRTTFTEPLEKGTFGAMIQHMAVKYPFARFIVPFVRTPLNIFSTALQHMPVAGLAARRLREDLAAGGYRRAQALGKQAIGFSLITMAIAEVSKGTITGSGPADPRIRNVWLKNNRPYSVRIDQPDGSVRWVSYARYEPMAQLFAIAADWAEIYNDKYNENQQRSSTNIAMALFMATMENSVNKTFTQGVYDFMKILSDPDVGSRERALNSMLASFRPNLMNQMNGDPIYREARTLTDAWRSRGSNYELVDPKRNVLGEVIYRPMPKVDPLSLAYRDVQDIDPVMEEITRLALINQTVAGNPNRTVNSPEGRVDLSEIKLEGNQSLYDAWVERTGTIEINGKTLRERLEETINSPRYLRAPDGYVGSTRGTKSSIVKGIISDYREAAKNDIPELVEILENSKRGEAQLLRKQAQENRQRQLLPTRTIQEEERRLLEAPRTLEDLINR